MSSLDFFVLFGTLGAIVGYGVYKTLGTKNIEGYLLGDKSMKWGTIGLSVMATQASAITFISTPGQAYESGMGFVQNYFGLPIALIIVATGLAQVKQLEMVFAFQPPEVFDLDAAVFEPTQPAFITIGRGLEQAGEAQLRAAAISFQEQNGEMVLGTLRLKLNDAFTADTQAAVKLVQVSIGPSSTERENFVAEVAQLEARIE